LANAGIGLQGPRILDDLVGLGDPMSKTASFENSMMDDNTMGHHYDHSRLPSDLKSSKLSRPGHRKGTAEPGSILKHKSMD